MSLPAPPRARLRSAPAAAPAAVPAARWRVGERRTWALAVLAVLAWSLHGAGLLGGSAPGSVLNLAGWPIAQRFLTAAAHPDLSPGFGGQVVRAALVTLAYAVLGTALALVLGVFGALPSSRTWWRGRRPGPGAGWAGWLLVRGALAVPRGVHEAVWGLLLVVVVGPGPVAGVLAIAVPFGAITAKVWGDLLDAAPARPSTALVAAGSGRLAACCYGLLPVVGTDLLSYALYRFDCAIRSAVVLGIVGAGGVGLLLDGAFQDLSYARMWTCIDALVLLCGLSAVLSRAVRRRLATSTRPAARTLSRAGAVGAAACLVSWLYLRADVGVLWSDRAATQATYLARAAWPPHLPAGGAGALLDAAAATVQMSVLATALATATSLVLAPLAARAVHGRAGLPAAVAGACCRAGLLLARAVPAPVWALVVLFVVHPGVLPGAVALGIHEVGVLGRLAGEVVEDTEPAPARALQASGAGSLAAFAYGVLPRAVPSVLAYAVYRWEVSVRETVVVGLVGAGGLGYLLDASLAAFDWHAAAGTLLALVALTALVDLAGTAARRAVR